jgi:hypothetical protein
MKGGSYMSVVCQFTLPVSYEEFKAFDKSINPEQLVPEGVSLHVVSKQESGVTVTDIWESEEMAAAFYAGVTAASGMPMLPISYSLWFVRLTSNNDETMKKLAETLPKVDMDIPVQTFDFDKHRNLHSGNPLLFTK